MNRRQFLLTTAAAPLLAADPKPNIILIYCDDLGYGDLGCYGSRIRTPNIDKMAAEGVRFTDFYSGNPVCSPSRSALLTGRYCTRVGVPKVLFPADKEGLDLSEKTLADVLKSQGYRTMCVGKWHLGTQPDYLPTRRGFDRYFGIPYSNDMNPRVMMRDADVIEQETALETLTPRYTEEATRFIHEAGANPFFLYLPHTYPHIPLGASPKFKGKSSLGIYGDVVEELDWSVGEILKAAPKNTLVLFSSDNGPWFQGSPGRLRGRKGITLEGGVRVPFIAHYPGKIKAGRVSNAVGSVMDIVPTITKLVGAPPSVKPLDGIDLWPALTGQAASTDREALLYFDGWNVQCARWKNWKLHVARYNIPQYTPVPAVGKLNLPLIRPELYNLEQDPDESYDVSENHPEVVAQIRQRIEKLLPGFPEEVQKAWLETQARKPNPRWAPGSLPAPAPQAR